MKKVRARCRARAIVRGGLILAAVMAGGSTATRAHHSFAMFDTANPVTIAGVVTTFEWTNPHAYIELDVPDGQSVKHWTIELGSPSILMRGGWKFNMIKKGDKVSAVVSPLKNGDPGSLLTRITLPDGRVFGNGGPAGVGPGVPATGAAAPQR